MSTRRGRPSNSPRYIPLDTPGVSRALGCPVDAPGALDRARLLLDLKNARDAHQNAERARKHAEDVERRARSRSVRAAKDLVQAGGDASEADALFKRLGVDLKGVSL